MNFGDVVRHVETGEIMIVMTVSTGSETRPESFLKVAGKDGKILPVDPNMFYGEHAFELIISIKDKER